MIRTDIHRPNAINPEDYEFVAHEVMKMETSGDAEVVMAERAKIVSHMARTGGKYSGHVHGGNCMVCGSVNAIYTLLFYHAGENVYVRMGSDCADKVFDSDFGHNRFRAAVNDAREAVAGKRKAQALLAERGLTAAWEIAFSDSNRDQFEERTITDIVDKLIRYGSLSDKQYGFLGSLLQRIENRAQIEAQRAAEAAAALDAPAGRVEVECEVLTTKWQDGYYGSSLKMLVRSVDGWKAWGTVPAADVEIERGMKIKIKATFEPKDDDPKFAYFKRPTIISA